MFFKTSLLPAGPVHHPSAPPSDAGDIPTWNSDDERDFAEHAYSPPSPMSHYPGSLNPLHQFLSHIPDWNSFDESALDHAPNTLCLPGRKRSRPCPTHAMLPEREPSQHYSSFLPACCSRRRCSRFQTRQRNRQQAFRGQHLDVALWESVPQEDLSGGC